MNNVNQAGVSPQAGHQLMEAGYLEKKAGAAVDPGADQHVKPTSEATRVLQRHAESCWGLQCFNATVSGVIR